MDKSKGKHLIPPGNQEFAKHNGNVLPGSGPHSTKFEFDMPDETVIPRNPDKETRAVMGIGTHPMRVYSSRPNDLQNRRFLQAATCQVTLENVSFNNSIFSSLKFDFEGEDESPVISFFVLDLNGREFYLCSTQLERGKDTP
jgi:hypothetical protein